MQRLMVVVVLAIPFVSAQALACGMEVAEREDQVSALAELMAMVDDAAEHVVDTVVESVARPTSAQVEAEPAAAAQPDRLEPAPPPRS